MLYVYMDMFHIHIYMYLCGLISDHDFQQANKQDALCGTYSLLFSNCDPCTKLRKNGNFVLFISRFPYFRFNCDIRRFLSSQQNIYSERSKAAVTL